MLAAVLAQLSPRAAAAEPPASKDKRDDFDLAANAVTNMQLFQRALIPGPGGSVVPTTTLMPFHQSISMAASRLDGPLAVDGTDVQVAAWGQIYAGSPEDQQQATWDLASAFVTQRLGPVAVSLGRQVISGGAARYRRMDGALVRARLPGGFALSGYAGWTALPRYDQWYGYHDIAAQYDDWMRPGSLPLYVDRGQNAMGGARIDYTAKGFGNLGFSFHGQGEQGTIESRNVGATFSFDRFMGLLVSGDAIFSLEQQRIGDLRLAASWDAFRKGDTALTVLGEFLHTVPSALLSQASIFSIFSYGEVTEAGGELDARLPLRFGVRLAGYAQTYNEGSPGARARGELRWALDDDETLLLRTQVARVSLETGGYWMLRAAARYAFLRDWALALDAYRYTYDQPVAALQASTFVSTQLVYDARTFWNARLGGTINESPYAAVDAQLLARVAIEWDRRRR